MKTITAFQCTACQHIMYPGHLRCTNCNERDFEEVTPSEHGKLVTYTIVNELPWGIDERGRVLGVIKFDNGIKALGLVKTEKPKIGMKLQVDWEPVRVVGGEKVYGLTFYPKK